MQAVYDGAAAASHLAAGRSIAIADPLYLGEVIRKWPDGYCEIVQNTENRDVIIVRAIDPLN